MKKTHIAILTTILMVVTSFFSLHAAAEKEVLLVDLTPSETEWGTDEWGVYPDMTFGPRIADYGGGWPRNPPFWEGEAKIIKEYPKDFKLDSPNGYRSINQECFVVAGEFMTGVGLFSRRTEFYYWIEYNIPEGAKTFDGDLYVSDDVTGAWGNGNDQWFMYRVSIDDKVIIEQSLSRGAPEDGSGELIDTMSFPIPEGAKKIRFYVKNIASGNGNANTELVIHNGKFILK
ncbi:hypothetical protein QQ056_05235 [Oscillatoria laete-virens NRMC-F 0139]|nr:hypothetical protein [Oscillatoria laete-virens]MDL5052958.1 hypothetical protein [Oscillatoria laete-virens NRMC-F 0139]